MSKPNSGAAKLETLRRAANDACTTPLDHFPPLITYACLADADVLLAKAASAALTTADEWLASELLTMPRKGSGPRPVNLLSPTARVAYETVVGDLSPALPQESRASGSWQEHRLFGRSGDHSHIVELDYASCYETIDHVALKDELLLRSMDPLLVQQLLTVLRKVEGSRGLPQMLSASDRLADTYLSIVDRKLRRDGLSLHRYADDIRVLAQTWEQANSILESTATYARKLGLILAGSKTGIRKKETLEDAEAAIEAFADRHFAAVDSHANDVSLAMSDYEVDVTGKEDPDEASRLAQVGEQIVQEWVDIMDPLHDNTGDSRTRRKDPSEAELPAGLMSYLGRAIKWSTWGATPLDPRVLVDIVFHHPLQLENVSHYLIERNSCEIYFTQDIEETVARLMNMGRQTPWAKLWLLHTATSVWPRTQSTPPVAIATWVRNQLSDSHEVVRAQAAWTLATWTQLEEADLSRLYVLASTVTQAALTACGPKGGLESSGTAKAMKEDSPLNEHAFAWAT